MLQDFARLFSCSDPQQLNRRRGKAAIDPDNGIDQLRKFCGTVVRYNFTNSHPTGYAIQQIAQHFVVHYATEIRAIWRVGDCSKFAIVIMHDSTLSRALKNRTLSPAVQLFIEHLRAVLKTMVAPARSN